jgi:hypothetical protein
MTETARPDPDAAAGDVAPPAPPAPPTDDAPTAEASAPVGKPHKARRIVSMVLVVLAAILIPVASTAVWAGRTALNTDRFVHTVKKVTSDPGVITVVSAKITDQAFQSLDGSQVVQDLPPALQPVVPVIIGALRSRVEGVVENVLSSDAGQKLLDEAVRRSHHRAMRLLQGDGLLSSDAFKVKNGTVTLDLIPVVRQVLIRLQEQGVIPSSVKIPAAGETSSSSLAKSLRAKLPPDFGQIVVYRSDKVSENRILDEAQHALVVLKRAVVLLVVLALLVAVAAVLVAVDRRRAVYRIGLGVAIVGVLLVVVARRASAAVANAAATPDGRIVAGSIAAALRSSLVRALLLLILLAMIIAVVARTWHGIIRLAGQHPDVARIVSVALGLIVLLVLGIGWGALIVAVVVVALCLLGVQRAAAATTARSSGPSSAGPPDVTPPPEPPTSAPPSATATAAP